MIKAVWLFFLLTLLTLVVGRGYLSKGIPITHDGISHIARFVSFRIALREGQFPPRLGSNLFNNYGYPVFNYNYPLPNVVGGLLSISKMDYQLIYLIYMVGFVIIGGVGVWYAATLLGGGWFSCSIALASYFSSQYAITLLYTRGNMGEIAAYGLFPWLLVSIEKSKSLAPLVLKNFSHSFARSFWQTIHANSTVIRDILFYSFIWTLFLLSHNISVMIGLLISILYALLRLKKRANFIPYCFMAFFSIAATLWFWLPAIAEKNQIVLDDIPAQQEFSRHYVLFSQLWESGPRLGYSYPGSVDTLALGFRPVHLLALSAAVFVILYFLMAHLLIRRHQSPGPVFVLSLLSVVLVSLQLSFSFRVWHLIPILSYVQFPWRLTLFTSVFLSLLAGLVVERSSIFVKTALIIILAWQIILSVPAEFGRAHFPNSFYDSFSESTSTTHENRPKTFQYQDFSDWQPTPKILSGTGEVEVFSWNGSSRSYRVNAITPVQMVEPTAYFLGWKSWIIQDSSEVPISYSESPEVGGRISYHLPVGVYDIRSAFTQETPARRLGNSISLLTLSLGVMLIVYLSLRTR